MSKRAFIFSVLVASSVLLSSKVGAAGWSFSPTYTNGWLTVWGTIDNQVPPQAPLIQQTIYVRKGVDYSGRIPGWCNDILPRFEWDAPCHNVEWGPKLFAPVYMMIDDMHMSQLGKWELQDLAEWLQTNLPAGTSLVFPCIGDSTGTYQTLYYGVNVQVWLGSPTPPQATYNIDNGECPDLPGYLIGTTPLVFDSLAAPDKNPFSTTPFTGQLYLSSEFEVNSSEIPALSHWGLVALVALLLLAALLVMRHRRISA